jgi:hypothetical protein
VKATGRRNRVLGVMDRSTFLLIDYNDNVG